MDTDNKEKEQKDKENVEEYKRKPGYKWEKYAIKKRVDGKRIMDNPVHEAVVYLVASGVAVGDIPKHLASSIPNGITVGEVEEIIKGVDAQNRIRFLSSEENKKPKSPMEYREWALKKLYKIAINATNEREQIGAASALARVSTDIMKDERRQKAALAPEATEAAPVPEGLEDLEDAFGEEGVDDEEEK